MLWTEIETPCRNVLTTNNRIIDFNRKTSCKPLDYVEPSMMSQDWDT